MRFIIGVLIGWAITAGAARAGELKAGAAKVEITPPTGYAMWGYGSRHDQPSEGVLDALHARALVLAAGSEKIAIVSLDLGRPPTRQSTAAIRARIKGAGIEHVFLVASHTHHGPVLELDDWPDAKQSYVRQLEQKLADLILEADKALKPARLGVASKEVPLNRNRHSKRDDKPVDRELLVLRLEAADGKARALKVPDSMHKVQDQYLEAITLLKDASAEMAKVETDSKIEHLVTAQNMSYTASEDLLKVEDVLWPGEHKPN